jgi:hypothetical protein
MTPPPILDPLRLRMAALVAAGPIRAREGYATLLAEGWTPNQICRAKRTAVLVIGQTRAAWWRAPRAPVTLAELAKRKRVVRVRRELHRPRRKPARAVAPEPERHPAPVVRSVATAKPPRVCAECGVPIGRRGPGEEPKCLRCAGRAA